MEPEARLTAESIGKAAYHEGKTFAETEEYARKRYNSGLLRACVLSGWNHAQWAESQKSK